MGRKRLPPEDQTSTIVLRFKDRLLAQAEAQLGPGENLQDFIRLALENELATRRNDPLLREANRALEIYRGLMKKAEADRAKILAERLGDLERMRDDVIRAFNELMAQSAPEPEPSIEELFGE